MAHSHAAEFRFNRERGRRRLIVCVAITAVTMVAEFVAGFMTGSLALISDAGHMLSHGLSLFISYAAMIIALRPAGGRRTFGLYRAEILAALFNGGSLIVLTGFIIWRAYLRMVNPVEIKAGWMLIVAVLGLAVNVVTAFVLRGSAREDINIRSAFLHMLGDMVSSIVVVAGALIIIWTGWNLIDPLLSVLVCVIILIWAYGLIRESVDVLLEAAPRHLDVSEIEKRLARIEGVRRVHDIHVWTITSGLYSMSAHVTVGDVPLRRTDALLIEIEKVCRREFGIAHSTIQMECAECETTDLGI